MKQGDIGGWCPGEAHNYCARMSQAIAKMQGNTGNLARFVLRYAPLCATIRVEMWDQMWDRCNGHAVG